MNFIKIKIFDLINQKTEIKKIPVEEILKILYPNSKIINSENLSFNDKGHPDYIIKGNKNFYVEWKSKNDTLQKSQIEWILKNKDKESKIIWLDGSEYAGFIEYECPSCGYTQKVFNLGEKNKPSKCICGRTCGFKIIGKTEW